MPLAQFKDLCLDATDPNTLGGFWAAALGLELHHQDNGHARLEGRTSAHTIWLNRVPEPKTVKNRLHLDIYSSDVEYLEQLGATVIDRDSFRWIVMADPEGGEFCVFINEVPPTDRLYEVVVDSSDHVALSTWWAKCLGGNRIYDDRGYSFISDIPHAPFQNLSFVPVSDVKASKNRIHIDVFAPDIDAIVALGAQVVRHCGESIGWTVLADPEGNEFCAFIPT